MKKFLTIDPRAEKELNRFSRRTQEEFKSVLYTLRIDGKLQMPEGKKIGNNLFEIRIKVGGVYRGMYAYVRSDGIVVLHFFQKKSQKTPIKSLKIAKKRFQDYEK